MALPGNFYGGARVKGLEGQGLQGSREGGPGGEAPLTLENFWENKRKFEWKIQKNWVEWGKIPILFGLEAVRGRSPGSWRIFEKINENSNEKTKKLSFMREISNIIWSWRGPGAKTPDVGEFLRKYTNILMKNSNKFELYYLKFQYFYAHC